jgi:hypothetical protein
MGDPKDDLLKPPKGILNPLEAFEFYVSKVIRKGDCYENNQTDHKNSNIALP